MRPCQCYGFTDCETHATYVPSKRCYLIIFVVDLRSSFYTLHDILGENSLKQGLLFDTAFDPCKFASDNTVKGNVSQEFAGV
jgi:hypothetical protein